MTAEQDAILGRLGEVWAEHPELKLGELIGNVFPTGGGNGMYFMSNDQFLLTIEDHYDPEHNPVDKAVDEGLT